MITIELRITSLQDRLHARARAFIICFDNDWQYPVITEENAYRCLSDMFPRISGNDSTSYPDIVYLGFPWATLIDAVRKGSDLGRTLYRELGKVSEVCKRATKVVTTCQHIHAHEHPRLFAHAGVTDIFWSHAPSNLSPFQKQIEGITIHPFQLYAAQAPKPANKDLINDSRREFLFSFTGASANQYYLSHARTLIGEALSGTKGAFIRVKEKWHYQDIVYETQINLNKATPVDAVVDFSYLNLLLGSDFSLCPVGTGPNTIRFWESMNTLSIPVVIGNYSALPPSSSGRWQEACIFIEDSPHAISEIPNILQSYSGNDLARMREELYLLSHEFSGAFFSNRIIDFMTQELARS